MLKFIRFIALIYMVIYILVMGVDLLPKKRCFKEIVDEGNYIVEGYFLGVDSTDDNIKNFRIVISDGKTKKELVNYECGMILYNSFDLSEKDYKIDVTDEYISISLICNEDEKGDCVDDEGYDYEFIKNNAIDRRFYYEDLEKISNQ